VRYQRYHRRMSDEREIEDVVFHVPAPPPPFPGVPPHAPRMLYVRHREEDGEGRDFEDLMLRKVPRETAMRFRAAAGGRGLTHAQYLTSLVALHEAARALAEGGDEAVHAELERLGLTTVTV
jgi:hypothetical protein